MSALVYQGFKLSFGVLYPAYSSFKAVRSKDVKGYVKWMMYWIVFALYVCVETLTDTVLFWFPFYCELKICFIVWLIVPMTKGSSLLYRKVIHPQLVKREEDIDRYIGRARNQGYQALLALGSRGFSFATNVVLTTAIKGSDQLKRSFSFGDLSMDEHQMMRLKRLGSTASLDSVDEMDSNAEEEMYRRDLSGIPLRRDLADDKQLDELDREINDLPRLQQGDVGKQRPGQLSYGTRPSGTDTAKSSQGEPTVGSVRLQRKYSLLTNEIMQHFSHLLAPVRSTQYRNCSFSFSGPTQWNALPPSLHDGSIILPTFKELLRNMGRNNPEDTVSVPSTPSVSDNPTFINRYSRSESLESTLPATTVAGSGWQSRSSYATSSSLQAATTLYRRH